MEKYRHNNNGKIANVISSMGAGMCNKTMGMTMVVYKYEGDKYEYPFIMEQKEFFNKHSEIPQT